MGRWEARVWVTGVEGSGFIVFITSKCFTNAHFRFSSVKMCGVIDTTFHAFAVVAFE